MDANVEYHPGGSQRLLVKRAETVGRAVEISEFHHEPLGVERPAFGVAAHQRSDTPPPVEFVAAVQSLCDLQMMTRDAFVVDGRAFLPRREPGLAPRHRPPHATGTGGQGLVQVNPRAEKGARVQRVQVPADGIAGRRPRHELAAATWRRGTTWP